MHIMKRQLKTSAMVMCLSMLLTTGAALADGWPAVVAGQWSVVGNQHVGNAPLGLTITQFPGAAGSQCKPIRGVLYGADNIEGFYSMIRYKARSR
jgi:hypothetical protein